MTTLIAIGAAAPVALLIPGVLWVRYRRRLHARDGSSTGDDLHKPSVDAPSVELEMTDIEAFHLARISGPVARCSICATDEPEAGGMRCRGKGKHFTCQDCLDGFVRSCATPDSAAKMDDGGWRLYCPLGPQCDARHPATAKALDPAEVRSRVSRGAWGAFERAKSDAAKAVAQRQRKAAYCAQRRPAILTAAAAGDELRGCCRRKCASRRRSSAPAAPPHSAAAWNVGWRAGHKHLHESCASNPAKNYYIPGETQAEAAAYIAAGHRAVKRRQLGESLAALRSAGRPRLLAALAPYAGVLRSELVWSTDDALAAAST